MPDYSFLMGAKPVELPNPLDLATKGVSLAGLMQNVDINAMTLEQKRQLMGLYKDPRYLQMLSGLMGGAAGGGAPGGGAPGGGAGGGMPDLSVLGDFPAAAPDALQNILKMRVEGAAATENLARASNYNQDVYDKRLAKVADAASAVMQNPTPQTISAYVNAHNFATPNPNAFGPAPTTMDPKAWQDFASNVYSSLSDPKVRAETAKMLVETKLAPTKVGIEQQQADTSQAKYALDYAKFYKGEPFQDPDSKKWFVRIPNPGGAAGFTVKPVPAGPLDQGAAPPSPANAGGNVVASLPAGFTPNMSDQQIAAALSDARANGKTSFSATGTDKNGKPVTITVPVTAAADVSQTPSQQPAKTGPDYREKELVKAAQPELAHLMAQSQASATMKPMITDLRNQEANGIFSGGVVGTEFFRKFANVMAATGMLSDAQREKLANTQSWDAETGQLVANAVSQFAGSRIAARELPFFQGVKPNLLQTAAGREQLYQHLWDISSRVQQQAAQAGEHMNKPGNTSLLNFQPTFKDEKMPPIKIDALPNPKTWDTSKALVDDKGNTLRVVNGKWQTTAGQSMADQVPQ